MKSPKPSRIRNNSSRERIAQEMRAIVEDAGRTAPPGSGVKALVRAAWENLGQPEYWRVLRAWQGYAGCWRGDIVDDFRQRKRAWERRQLAEATEEAADHVAHLARLRDALAHIDESFHRTEIDALEWAIERHRVRHAGKRED